MKHSTAINYISIIFIFFLLLTISKDIIHLISFYKEKSRFSNYFNSQSSSLDISIAKMYLGIKNTYTVMYPRKQQKFMQYQGLDSTSLYKIDKIVHDQHNNSYDIAHHRLQDIDDIKCKIVNSRWDYLALFYQKLLHIELLRQIDKDQSCCDSDVFCSYECARSITEDSIYLGVYSNCSASTMTKYTHTINGVTFDENSENIFSIPKADSITIVSKSIINNFTHLDTVIAAQTISKRNGRWWNINSPDPISR